MHHVSIQIKQTLPEIIAVIIDNDLDSDLQTGTFSLPANVHMRNGQQKVDV